MKHLAFIIHGKIRRKDKFKEDVQTVLDRGYVIRYYITQHKGHATSLVVEALKAGATEIIAVGGDGTLNEVINGVMHTATKENIPSGVAISVFPKGTANDFAKTIKMSADLRLLKNCIGNDLYNMTDLGAATFKDTHGQPVSRYFINITDIGVGGIVARKTSGSSKWMGAYLTFQWAIMTTLLRFKKQRVKLKTEKQELSGDMMNVVVANGKYFGSGIGIAPHAKIDDGKFSLVTIGDISLIDYLMFSRQLKTCREVNHPEVHYNDASRILLEAEGTDLPVDMDGEFVGYTPLSITLLPAAIKFRMPGV